ncbi:MAG: hypothetical protein JWN25_2284 [Verrucomicrobiales bacterium]|jgi:Rod binding domain-containing protein|nr:hypothetical protein [Verrucomicrobiales bacterium]MDB6131177.1 hypothetical protein [Verrucomicrobiales bacterium]
MEAVAISSSVHAKQVSLENLQHNSHLTDEEKIAEVSRQFEAVLLRQILQEARKSVIHSSLSESSSNTKMYDDLITTQMAESISSSRHFGLAASLEKQLGHQVLPKSKTDFKK